MKERGAIRALRECHRRNTAHSTGIMLTWSDDGHVPRWEARMRQPNGRSPLPLRPATAAVLVLLSGVACASHSIVVLPRLNLAHYGSVGLIPFSIENAKGTLHELATQRFEEYLLAAQAGIEVQHFPLADSATALSGGGPRAVPVVFLGHLKVSNVKPSGGLIGLSLPHLEATITAELSVWLCSTKTAGTLWRSSAAATEKGGGAAPVGGPPEVFAREPQDASGAPGKRLG